MWKLTWDVKINFSCQNTQCIAIHHLWFIFIYISDFLPKGCGYTYLYIDLYSFSPIFLQKNKTNYFTIKKKWLPKFNIRSFWTKRAVLRGYCISDYCNGTATFRENSNLMIKYSLKNTPLFPILKCSAYKCASNYMHLGYIRVLLRLSLEYSFWT